MKIDTFELRLRGILKSKVDNSRKEIIRYYYWTWSKTQM